VVSPTSIAAISYSALISYATKVADYTSAPPAAAIDPKAPHQPQPYAFRPPFPQEAVLSRARLMGEGPIGPIGEFQLIGEGTLMPPNSQHRELTRPHSDGCTARRTYYVKCAEATIASRTHEPARSKETSQSQHGHLRFGSQPRHVMRHVLAGLLSISLQAITWDELSPFSIRCSAWVIKAG
jgi:hypothetical protein